MCVHLDGVLSRFQDVLLDFTVQYLIEQPEELVEFALAYFSRLKSKRAAVLVQRDDEDNQNSDESMLSEEDGGN